MRLGIFALCLTCLLPIGFAVGQGFRLEISESLPQGTIREGGETCRWSWRVFSPDGSEMSAVDVRSRFARFRFRIAEFSGGRETKLHEQDLPTSESACTWAIPEIWQPTRYRFTLTAMPQIGSPALAEFSVYARPTAKKMEPPDDYDKCMRVLADWNGRRGYCEGIPVAAAWQRARDACRWLRENASEYSYEDCLETVEKVEATKLANIRVYCPVEHASLRVDGIEIGFFREWDPKRRKFWLETPLPADGGHACRLEVRDGRRSYETSHTHNGESECSVDSLRTPAQILLRTPGIPTQAALEGRAFGKSSQIHVLEAHCDAVQVLRVKVEGGPDLRIPVLPGGSMRLLLETSHGSYSVHCGKDRYDFLGNQTSLIR